MKAKQGMHPRSKSFSEEPVHNLGNSNMHRQVTYDDSQTRKMDVEGDQDVWMNVRINLGANGTCSHFLYIETACHRI